jgi:hypothetical protein
MKSLIATASFCALSVIYAGTAHAGLKVKDLYACSRAIEMSNQDQTNTGSPLAVKNVTTPVTNAAGQVVMNQMSYLVLSANGIETFPDTTPVAMSNNYAQCIDTPVVDETGKTVNKRFRVSSGGGLQIQGPTSCPDSLLSGSNANPKIIKPDPNGSKYGFDAPVPGNGLNEGLGCGSLAALLESSDGYNYIRGQAACDVEKAKSKVSVKIAVKVGSQRCGNGPYVANQIDAACGKEPEVKRAVDKYSKAVGAAGFSGTPDGFTAQGKMSDSSRASLISDLSTCQAGDQVVNTQVENFTCTVVYTNTACTKWAAMGNKSDSAKRLVDGVLKSDSACSTVVKSGYCDKVVPTLKTELAAAAKTATADGGVKPASGHGPGSSVGAH